MPHFAKQLTTARKAKGMTQEQLAQAVHISRSRVSRWETGETVPDVDMIRKLSEVLEVDLLSDGKKEETKTPPCGPEEPVQDIPQPEEEAAAASAAPTAAKRPWWMAVLAGAAVLAVVLLILLWPGKEEPAVVYEPYTLEWYQQVQAPVKGHAYVTILPRENPVKAIRFADFEGGVGWLYTFGCNETNGVPFTVTKIVQTVFNAQGQDDMVFEGEMLLQVMNGDPILRTDRSQPMDWGGGFPLQPVKAVGLALAGVDANGNELIFRGYVELSQEIAE